MNNNEFRVDMVYRAPHINNKRALIITEEEGFDIKSFLIGMVVGAIAFMLGAAL